MALPMVNRQKPDQSAGLLGAARSPVLALRLLAVLAVLLVAPGEYGPARRERLPAGLSSDPLARSGSRLAKIWRALPPFVPKKRRPMTRSRGTFPLCNRLASAPALTRGRSYGTGARGIVFISTKRSRPIRCSLAHPPAFWLYSKQD
jgi:hypothetical protein